MTKDHLLLRDILECIDNILEFTAEGRAAFLKDKRTQHAVIRNFEVMGEAAKRVSPSLRDAHPEVPWALMARTRDKLIHDYPGVDPLVVWRAIERELQGLRGNIERLLKESRTD